MSQNENNNFSFATGIGPMTDRVLNTVLDRLSTDKFREKLTDKIVGPVTNVVSQKVKPYIYLTIGLYAIVIILLIIIIYMLMKKQTQ